MAAKASGGFVIAQVERLAAADALPAKQVEVPGVLVDCVVLAPPEHHGQTYATAFSPAFSGQLRVPLDRIPRLPLDERKIIARRCAMELPMGGVVNLGIGVPEAVLKAFNCLTRSQPLDQARNELVVVRMYLFWKGHREQCCSVTP